MTERSPVSTIITFATRIGSEHPHAAGLAQRILAAATDLATESRPRADEPSERHPIAEAEKAFAPRPISEAPTDPDRTILPFCPEQGGWQMGVFFGGLWGHFSTPAQELKLSHWCPMLTEPASE